MEQQINQGVLTALGITEFLALLYAFYVAWRHRAESPVLYSAISPLLVVLLVLSLATSVVAAGGTRRAEDLWVWVASLYMILAARIIVYCYRMQRPPGEKP